MSLATYLEMLTYKRPAGCKAEKQFIRKYLKPLGCLQDNFGNLYLRIGNAPVLWSSHTDTVHHEGGRQPIDIGEDGWITTPSSNCLGADCTTGVYIMCEMIKAGVEGLYVFHRCEEIGGQGSNYIANKTPELLKDIKFAIAFDRKDFSSVITHQFGDRCCSDEFAHSLRVHFGDAWFLDDGGTFTDTATYTELVGECTNLSVGYFDAHTRKERQSWPFLEYLLERLTTLDLGSLVSKRQPGDTEGWWDRRYDKARGWSMWDDDGNDILFEDLSGVSQKSRNRKLLLEAILDHTDAVAEILGEYGITADDILTVASGNHLAASGL